MEVRLEWEGKPTLVERLSLPFQTVETINESRATRERDTGALFAGGERLGTADYNRLIWGDNKVVMSSLLDEYAGRLKLIYIDPPFDTGADFAYRVSVGEAAVEKLPSILEEHAYRDTWGKGRGSYLTMLYERLVLMHELLAGDGSLFVHLDWHQGHYVKVLLDEIFGQGRFLNEIVWWYYNKFQGNINRFASNHDVIFGTPTHRLLRRRGPPAGSHEAIFMERPSAAISGIVAVGRQRAIAGRGEPGPGAAALALLGKSVPSLELAGPAGQLVLEGPVLRSVSPGAK